MSIQTPFQVQMPFGMLTACCARDLGYPLDPVCGTLDIVRCDQETGHAIGDYLPEPTAIERDNGSPARQCVSGGHAAS